MRILLCGDTPGVSQLLAHVPAKNVVGIIAATIRPQYLETLDSIALKSGVKLFVQPKWKTDKYKEFLHEIIQIKADLILINSYSMIIRQDLLSTFRLGGINIHGALLPRNRGCNPIQWAIINKEYETGVTLHEIDNGIDTGPIVDQLKIPIFFHDSWLDVRARLLKATNKLLKKNIATILSGKWKAVPQINTKATLGRRRNPKDGEFLWSEKIIDIHNKIRALLPPLPSAFYLDQNNQRTEFTHYQTPWELTVRKYGECGSKQFIQSQIVRLLPLQKKDSDLLNDWFNDQNFPLCNSNYTSVLEENYGAWIEYMMTKRSDIIVFAIKATEGRKPIGTCSLLNVNWKNRSAEIQLLVGESQQLNLSYGSEVINLLCGFAFEDLNLHRVHLHVFADDTSRIKVYEKNGFISERCHKEAVFAEGCWKDVLYMNRIKWK